MKLLVLISLAAYVGYGQSTCNVQHLAVDSTSGTSISLGGTSRRCGLLGAIGSSRNPAACYAAGREFKVLASNFPTNKWMTGSTIGSRTNGCTSKARCNLQFNKPIREDFDWRCRKAVYRKVVWVPKNRSAFCNLTSAQRDPTRSEINDAVYYSKSQLTAGYGCCTTGNDCNTNINFGNDTQCPSNGPLENFYNRTNVCWNRFRAQLLHHRWCDPHGDRRRRAIATTLSTCFKNRRWDPTKCGTRRRIFTCSRRLRRLLTLFGNCACSAAVNNGYGKFGAELAGAFEDGWNEYCPDLDLRCNDNTTNTTDPNYGRLISRYPVRKIRWRFRLAKRWLLFPQSVRDKIRKRIAERMMVDDEDVTITSVSNTAAGSRRLLQTEQTEATIITENDGGTVPNIDEAAVTAINSGLDAGEKISGSLPTCVRTGEGNIDMNGDITIPDDNCYPASQTTSTTTTPPTTTSEVYGFRLFATVVVAFIFAVSLV